MVTNVGIGYFGLGEKGMKFGGCSFGFGNGLFVFMLWGEEHFGLWLEGSSIFIMFMVDCSNLWFSLHLLQLEAGIETLLDESCLNREPYVMYVYAMRRNVPLCSSISTTKEHWSESAPQLYRAVCLAVTSPLSTPTVKWTFCALKRVKTYARSRTGLNRVAALAPVAIEKDFVMELKSRDHLTFFLHKGRRVDGWRGSE